MRNILTICLIMALSLGAYAQTKKIALLEPRIAEGSTEVSAMEKNMVRGELRKAIVNESGYEAFTRADIDQIMKEQNFQRTGMVSNDQIKRLGEMSGADCICISTLTKSSTEFYLEAYLINVEDGGISNPATQYGELVNGKLANMLPVCKDLAKELVNSSGGRSNYIGGNNSRGSSSATNSVTDCQGHTYPVVKIGNQYWMAENLQCTKYDTESESYKNGVYIIGISTEPTFAPFYADGRNMSNIDDSAQYHSFMSNEQIRQLGLLYNWAAAMGYNEIQSNIQVAENVGYRQGICPNGWHVPNNEEWNKLHNYISREQKLTSNQIGGFLKTNSGWFENGNGSDIYGFRALPAGTETINIGKNTSWWSASPCKKEEIAYTRSLSYDSDSFFYSFGSKNGAKSIRCVKNK